MSKRRVARARRNFRYIAVLAILLLAGSFFVVQRNASMAAINHNLVKYSKSKMTRITLKKVFSAKRPKGYGSLQGFAMTDKYYVMILRPPGQEDNNRVEVHRRSDNKDITSSFKNPTYNMGHGNDATWNNKTNEVVVIDGSRKQLVRIDAKTFKKNGTTKLVNKKGTALGGGGIAYDKERNIYYMSSGTSIRTFNTKNQLVSSFDEKHHQTNQGFSYNNGYFYRPTWESAGTYKNSIYDKIFKKNTTVIYQFGRDGSFTHAYYIDNPLYEVESMAFDEHNVPYIAFNGPSGHYTVYKVTNSDLLKKLRQSFTISYYGNGGSGAPKDQTAYVGVEKNLSKTKPTRKNYTFLGWSTNKDAKKASYSAGAKYMKAYGKSNSNVKLYAVWEESKYTITYNANGGSGAPAMQTVGVTKTAKLSTTKPTRANYTFLGWSTNKGATAASYQAGAAYNDKKSITLYAVWRTNTYTITYNANGGSGAPVTQNATINQAVTLSATRPVRSGYTFLGWATRQDATSAQYASGAQYTGSKNVTLYAVWKQNPAQNPPATEKITITYDANGGTNVPPATTAEIGKVVITAVRPTRAYFTFLGWSTSRAATTASYQPGASYTGNTSTTLYAVWKQNVVVISYNANGGTNAPANQVVPAGQVARLSAAKPVLSGYTFLGWSPDKNAKEGEYAPDDTITLAVDLVLYAIWERTPNTITFDANAGTNAPLPISTTGEIVLPEDRPVRAGYVFVGWSKDKNSTTAAYYPGDIIKNPENMTLYAVWQVATPMPIEGQADNENDDNDENINDASAINDGEEDDSVEVSELDPSELPNTGPAEVAVATIALVCICSGAAYWYMSSRQLKNLQKTVRGHHIESRKKRKK